MQVIDAKHKRPSRKRRKRAQILELLREFESSKMRVRDFCNLHSIGTGIFYKWKNRYLAPQIKAPGFAPLTIASPAACVPRLFAEVKGIRIYQPVSASFLKELLA